MAKLSITTLSGENIHVKQCISYFDKLSGLMFRKSLSKNEGIVFLYNQESRINSTIHMLFMRFPITVLWVNQNKVIVDKVLALPWRLAYAPSKPANTIFELHAQHIDEFKIGDKIIFDYEN
ncbi:MAG: DUF192 domain-containing protein [Anaerolineaceae bacterium]|nr:DUF192 domain-containing protein [Anaerolineaceae bacterium]